MLKYLIYDEFRGGVDATIIKHFLPRECVQAIFAVFCHVITEGLIFFGCFPEVRTKNKATLHSQDYIKK